MAKADIDVKVSKYDLRCMICEAPLGKHGEAVCRGCVVGGPREAARRARENAREFNDESVVQLIETTATFLDGLSQVEYLELITREKLRRCPSDRLAQA